MTVKLRWAERHEAAVLEALQRRSSLVWESDRDDLLAHPDAIDDPRDLIARHQVRVAVEGGRIVGFSAVVPGEGTDAELDGLFVDPDRMGQGIGTLLLDDLVGIARAAGFERLSVIANSNALGFYERAGMVSAGTVATRFSPALRMHLPLTR